MQARIITCLTTIALLASLSLVAPSDAATSDAQLLERSEVDVLSQRAKAVANVLGVAFEAMVSDMCVFRNTSESLISGKTKIKAYSTSYPKSGSGPGSAEGANNLHSGWFNKQSSSPSATVNTNLDVTSLFRHAWLTVRPNWLGVGFGDTDALARFFPFSTNTGLSSYTSTCVSNNQSLNGTSVTGYDPRCRGWYAAAEASPSEIHFSEPYVDVSTGETVTTLSTAVMDNNGTFFGAIFGDVSLTYLKSVINEGWPTANAMKGDHRFLLHDSGSIVISNVFTAGATLAESLYPSSTSLRASFTSTLLPRMVAESHSRLTYTLADNSRYAGAVARVPGTEYHVGVFSLESNLDAFTTTNAIKEIGNDIAAYVTRFLESAYFQNLQGPNQIMEQIYAISSEIQYQTSYQDDTVALDSSLTVIQDVRLPTRTGKICLSNSTWLITDHTSSTTQSSAQTTLIQQTQLLDPYFRSIYSTSPDYVTWLFCSGPSSKVFRKYPGALTSDLTYDCSGRDWYTAAIAQSTAMSSTAVRHTNAVLYFWTAFTPAYKDAFSGEWMITASIQMHTLNAQSDNVFGVDLLLNTLSAVFKEITFFTTGKATLVDLTDGTIIADKTLFLDGASSKAYSYTDLTSPSVSNLMFNEFIAAGRKNSDRTLLTSTTESNGDCYFLYFTSLAHPNLDRFGVILSVKSLNDTTACESLASSGGDALPGVLLTLIVALLVTLGQL